MSSVLTDTRPTLADGRRAPYEYDRCSALGRLLQTASVDGAMAALDGARRGWVVASVDVDAAQRTRRTPLGESADRAEPAPAATTLWYGGGQPVGIEELARVAERHPLGLPGALVCGSISGAGARFDVGDVDVVCVRLHILPAGKATTTYVRLRVVGVDVRA